MTGQAVARILLVSTLIVTAHAIKPFSVKNITTHLLYSTRSFAIILPGPVRSSFDHTNRLAMTLTNSLLGDGQAERSWPGESVTDSAVVAVTTQPQALAGSNNGRPTVKAVRASIGPQIIARRTVRSEQKTDEELTGRADETEENEAAGELASNVTGPADTPAEPTPVVLPAVKSFSDAMPVTLPVIPVTMACALSKVRPIIIEMHQIMPRRIKLLYQPKNADCEKYDSKPGKLIALVEEAMKLKSDLSETDISLFSILECEDEGTDVESVESTKDEDSKAAEADELTRPELPRASEGCSMIP